MVGAALFMSSGSKLRFTLFKYARSHDEERGCGDYARSYIGYTLAVIHTADAHKDGQDKARRNEQYYLSEAGDEDGNFCLVERNEHILQGHLRKEENCTHHKDGRILHDYAHYLGTSPEQIPVSLRSENGQQPHACAAAQCDGRNYCGRNCPRRNYS